MPTKPLSFSAVSPWLFPLVLLLCMLFAQVLQAREISATWDTRYTGANHLQRLEFSQAESVDLTLNLTGNVPEALTNETTVITWQIWDWNLTSQWANATGTVASATSVTAALTPDESNMPPGTYRAYLVASDVGNGLLDVLASQALTVRPSPDSALYVQPVPPPMASTEALEIGRAHV